ncbi:hypothetical protein THASP1DRAFT_22762 [Thamnocephalis sphaerospora]|uniref:Uncharacterized protein n=1 Tax=Thamnocephalis sphaerospora TaxID=78915 RepID=A0A4P9XT95_9FUNG|nr:hypothetical protein THASP1DRAFT_22762 [Thamnocephalis sphaerospora]|eukprot:RKP09388.1 hypothetical protein THASP1DRAFT_22762 [Thamnocephalis sphaerospora]
MRISRSSTQRTGTVGGLAHFLWPLLAVILMCRVTVTHARLTINVLSRQERNSFVEEDDWPTTVVYPTYGYFQGDPAQMLFNITGAADSPWMSRSSPCVVQFSPDLGLKTNTNDHKTAITVISWGNAMTYGCQTIAQLANAVVEYSKRRVEFGYVPISALVVSLNTIVDNVSGGPYSEAYTSTGPSITETMPDLPVALLPEKYMSDLAKQQRRAPTSFKLEGELGPWNVYFGSIYLKVFQYVLVALSSALMAYGLFAMIRLIRAGEFRIEQRNVVFLLGMVSTALFIAMLPMGAARHAFVILSQLCAITFTCGFYILIDICSWLTCAINQGGHPKWQRGVICASGFVIVACYVYQIIHSTLPTPYQASTIRKIINYLVPSIQLMNAIAFLYFGIAFYRSSRKFTLNHQTHAALTHLTRVTAAGFASIIILTIANSLIIGSYGASTPERVFAHHVLNHIAVTLRSAGLLWIFSVRMPANSQYGTDSTPLTWRDNSNIDIQSWSSSFVNRVARRLGIQRFGKRSRHHDTSNLSMTQPRSGPGYSFSGITQSSGILSPKSDTSFSSESLRNASLKMQASKVMRSPRKDSLPKSPLSAPPQIVVSIGSHEQISTSLSGDTAV